MASIELISEAKRFWSDLQYLKKGTRSSLERDSQWKERASSIHEVELI